LLKITVPKRTGRKRKRGSDEHFTLDETAAAVEEACKSKGDDKTPNLRSHSRLDHPKCILRTLKDNVGKYQIEAIGSIDQTHRYRGEE
jgi:general transcription factor 3C polypeptide 5 (transcription factor C subunit 1)